MNIQPVAKTPRISAVWLFLIATLLGLAGTALTILQALYWLHGARTNRSVLTLTACVPLIAAVVFAVVPRRAPESDATDYPLYAPMAWINLVLPVLLTALAAGLIGAYGSFENFVGFALLLAANAGRNLRDFVRALMSRTLMRHP